VRFDTLDCRAEIIAELTPRLKTMKDLYSCWSDDEILYTLISILEVCKLNFGFIFAALWFYSSVVALC